MKNFKQLGLGILLSMLAIPTVNAGFNEKLEIRNQNRTHNQAATDQFRTESSVSLSGPSRARAISKIRTLPTIEQLHQFTNLMTNFGNRFNQRTRTASTVANTTNDGQPFENPSSVEITDPTRFMQQTTLNDDDRLFVIGDIHARKKTIEDIIKILNKAGAFVTEETSYERADFRLKTNVKVVCLGDYVDRGASDVTVLKTLLNLKITNPKNVFLLKGNHEFEMSLNTIQPKLIEGQRNPRYYTQNPLARTLSIHEETINEYLNNMYTNVFNNLPEILFIKYRGKIIQLNHGGISGSLAPQIQSFLAQEELSIKYFICTKEAIDARNLKIEKVENDIERYEQNIERFKESNEEEKLKICEDYLETLTQQRTKLNRLPISTALLEGRLNRQLELDYIKIINKYSDNNIVMWLRGHDHKLPNDHNLRVASNKRYGFAPNFFNPFQETTEDIIIPYITEEILNPIYYSRNRSGKIFLKTESDFLQGHYKELIQDLILNPIQIITLMAGAICEGENPIQYGEGKTLNYLSGLIEIKTNNIDESSAFPFSVNYLYFNNLDQKTYEENIHGKQGSISDRRDEERRRDDRRRDEERRRDYRRDEERRRDYRRDDRRDDRRDYRRDDRRDDRR